MTQLILEAMTEKVVRITMIARKTIRFLHKLLWMTSLFSRHATALLADIRDNALDPELSAQLVQAGAQAYLSFGEEKGKGKGESKDKGKGKRTVRPSCLPLQDRRQRLRELKAKTECRACGRKGQWAHDRECAMSPLSLSSKTQTHTTQLHVSS